MSYTKKTTLDSKGMQGVEIIEENFEDDEDKQSFKNLQKQIDEKVTNDERRKSTFQRPMLGIIGKSNSNIQPNTFLNMDLNQKKDVTPAIVSS